MLRDSLSLMLKNLIALSLVEKRTSQITPMSLCGNRVEWCETIKYIGVYVQGGMQLC